MLLDEHRREMQYALEYTMLAILNQLPPPAPPRMTWAQINQKLRDIKHGIVRPIPVPHDWKPCLKVPQHMLETQTISQLESQIRQLQRLITKTLFKARFRNKNKGYILRANDYLSKAIIYLNRARTEKFKATAEQFRANSERTKAELERLDEELKKAREPKNQNLAFEQLRAYNAKSFEDVGCVGKTMK